MDQNPVKEPEVNDVDVQHVDESKPFSYSIVTTLLKILVLFIVLSFIISLFIL